MKTIRADGEDLLLTLRVQPRARDKKNAIVLRDDAIVVRLSAPPVDGKANAELVKLIARLFSRPKSAISVERGHKSRDKLVRPEALNTLGLRLEQACRS